MVVERKRAASDLAVARLQVRIDETADQVDNLRQRRSWCSAATKDCPAPYDGGLPLSSGRIRRGSAACQRAFDHDRRCGRWIGR